MADPVGAIRFDYPVVTPTTTLFFRPGEKGMIIVRDAPEPVQWIDEAIDLSVTFKELSTNIKEQWRVTFSYMEATEALAGISGFTALKGFFDSTVSNAREIWKLTDKNGESLTCRLIPGSFQFERGQGQIQDIYIFGSFTVIKVS